MPRSTAGLAEDLLAQARACAVLGSPLYDRVLRGCVDDLAAGGPVARLLAPHRGAPRDAATGLRLLGGVHHLVLTGRAPRLAAQYPSTGGTPGEDLVPAVLAVLDEQADDLVPWLAHPPQTNEVGRSSALVGGLLRVLAGRDLPVRLHEVGASAGLNLNADRYRYQAGEDGPWWGPGASPVRLAGAWLGSVPDPGAPLRVLERVGSDVAPVDLAAPGAAERLLAYVWADQVPRLERLRAALAVAAAHPVRVDRLGAPAAVRRVRLQEGSLTVLWHSVMWQYVAPEEQQAAEAALDALGSAATPAAPLARLSLEPARGRSGAAVRFVVTATTWPGGAPQELGVAAPHGVPVTWSPSPVGPLPTLRP